jgi:hypothetical protein
MTARRLQGGWVCPTGDGRLPGTRPRSPTHIRDLRDAAVKAGVVSRSLRGATVTSGGGADEEAPKDTAAEEARCWTHRVHQSDDAVCVALEQRRHRRAARWERAEGNREAMLPARPTVTLFCFVRETPQCRALLLSRCSSRPCHLCAGKCGRRQARRCRSRSGPSRPGRSCWMALCVARRRGGPRGGVCGSRRAPGTL